MSHNSSSHDESVESFMTKLGLNEEAKADMEKQYESYTEKKTQRKESKLLSFLQFWVSNTQKVTQSLFFWLQFLSIARNDHRLIYFDQSLCYKMMVEHGHDTVRYCNVV